MKRTTEFWVTLATMSVIAAIDAVKALDVAIPAGITVAIAAIYGIARTWMTMFSVKPPEELKK